MSRSPSTSLLVDAFGRIHESVIEVVAGLGEEALTWRPAPDANSIAWLVWHLTRVQDDHLAGIAAALGHDDADQVWVAGGWAARFDLGLPVEDIGYGHATAEVARVRASGELLADYHHAVHERTVAVLDRLSDDDQQRIVDERWTPPVTAAVRIVSVVDDTARHIGQAEYVRGLWEQR